MVWPTDSQAVAGSMFSTIGDYAKFVDWVLDGADLPASIFQEMQTPHAKQIGKSETIGLAWHLIAGNQETETLLYHEGREAGVYTLCIILPKTKKAVVILTNGNNGELIAKRIVETVLPNGSQIIQTKSHEMWRTLQAMSRRRN